MHSLFGKVRISSIIRRTRGYLAIFLIAGAAVHGQETRPVVDSGQPRAISYDRLLDYLSQGGRDEFSDAIAIRLIEQFGLAFRPTPEEFARLRSAREAALLMVAIERARKPELPAGDREGRPVHMYLRSRRLRCFGSTKIASAEPRAECLPWVALPPGARFRYMRQLQITIRRAADRKCF